MPKLSASIEIDGRYYCWDANTDRVYELDIKFTPVGEESAGAVKTLVLQKAAKNKERPE